MAAKQIQQSKTITLSSTMKQRNNPVYLENVEDNQTAFAYLQNSDSFFTNSLASRQGTEDFCGGPVQYNQPSGMLYANTNSGTLAFSLGSLNDNSPNHTVDVSNLIIADRDIVLISGTYTVRRNINYIVNPAQTVLEKEFAFRTRVSVFQTDGKQLPASGAGYFASYNTSTNGKVFSTRNNVFYDTNSPFATTYPLSGTNPQYYPLGQTDNIISFHEYTDDGVTLTSEPVDVHYVFESPVTLLSGNVYAIKYEHMTLSGTGLFGNLNYLSSTIPTSGTDPYPNIVAATLSSGNGTQMGTIIGVNNVIGKFVVTDKYYEYAKPVFINNDIPSANISLITPFSGSYFYSGASYAHFNPIIEDLPVNTNSVKFGNITSIVSGTSLQGAYFYACPWGTQFNANNINPGNIPVGTSGNIYSRNHEIINPFNYQLNLKCELSEIISSSGTIGTAGYTIFQTNPIAEATTSYTFHSKDILAYSPIGNPNIGDLNKIYFLFDEPITTTYSGNHLLTWKFETLDNTTLTDFGFISYSGNGYITSPLQVGYIQSGNNFVAETLGNSHLKHPTINNSSLGFSGSVGSINSGLISLGPSGAPINGIVDYTNSSLVQWIAYHQADKIRAFQLSAIEPQHHITIHSGLQNNPNALATYETYDDMLLSTNYGFNQPQTWDSSYINLSGSSTYDLGHGAAFSGNAASGVGNLVSGTYSFLFATELISGGFRASTLSGITVNGSGVGNNSIIHLFVGSGSIANQYPFDIPTTHGATRIFMNLPSGIAPDSDESIFYLANLSVSGTLAGSYYPNPLPNNISDFYITNLSGVSTLQVPDVISESQSYLQNQFIPEIPKFKKVLRWYDYIMAFGGDDQSLLYYSQIGCPQIYGGVSSKYGFLTIGNNSGSPITSIARYKQWLLVFTKNTMWRITYQGSSSTPFLVEPISTKNGDIGVFSTVETDDAIFGINQYGIFAANSNGIECISKDIDPFFKELNKDQLTFSTGLLNQDRREIYWSITNDVSNPDSEVGLTFNYEFNTISVRRGGLFNSAGVIRDEFGFDILLGGDFNGFINKISANTNTDVLFGDGVFQTTEPIQFVYETEWMYLTGDTYNKFLDRFHQNIETNTGNLILQVFFDGKTTPSYTRKMKMTGNNPDKISILGGQAVSVKFRVFNQGNLVPIKIDSMSIDFHTESNYRPF